MTDDYKDFSSDIAEALGGDTESAGGEAKEEASADAKPEAADSESGDKTERTWQSKADAATARANKAEQELATLKAEREKAAASTPEPTQAAGSADPWVEASKGNFRDDLYKSDPRLEQLNLSPDLIQGSTPSDMKKSFESLQDAVNKMESTVRNRVLIEHGLQPVPGGGERATGVNYETMPKEEFDKIVARAMSG